MTERNATVLDDITGIEKLANVELIKMTLVSAGRPLDVVLPVEAAAKAIVRLLDIFQRDDRPLEARRNLSEPEFAGGVQLLQIREATVEAPKSRNEQLHLALLLDDGLVLNFALDEPTADALAGRAHDASQRYQLLPRTQPN